MGDEACRIGDEGLTFVRKPQHVLDYRNDDVPVLVSALKCVKEVESCCIR